MDFIALIRCSVGLVTFCSKTYNWVGLGSVYSWCVLDEKKYGTG